MTDSNWFETWLQDLSLTEYIPQLEGNNLTTPTALSSVTKDQLKSIGIVKLGHLNRLCKAIERLKDDTPSNVSRPVPVSRGRGSTLPVTMMNGPSSNAPPVPMRRSVKQTLQTTPTNQQLTAPTNPVLTTPTPASLSPKPMKRTRSVAKTEEANPKPVAIQKGATLPARRSLSPPATGGGAQNQVGVATTKGGESPSPPPPPRRSSSIKDLKRNSNPLTSVEHPIIEEPNTSQSPPTLSPPTSPENPLLPPKVVPLSDYPISLQPQVQSWGELLKGEVTVKPEGKEERDVPSVPTHPPPRPPSSHDVALPLPPLIEDVVEPLPPPPPLSELPPDPPSAPFSPPVSSPPPTSPPPLPQRVPVSDLSTPPTSPPTGGDELSPQPFNERRHTFSPPPVSPPPTSEGVEEVPIPHHRRHSFSPTSPLPLSEEVPVPLSPTPPLVDSDLVPPTNKAVPPPPIPRRTVHSLPPPPPPITNEDYPEGIVMVTSPMSDSDVPMTPDTPDFDTPTQRMRIVQSPLIQDDNEIRIAISPQPGHASPQISHTPLSEGDDEYLDMDLDDPLAPPPFSNDVYEPIDTSLTIDGVSESGVSSEMGGVSTEVGMFSSGPIPPLPPRTSQGPPSLAPPPLPPPVQQDTYEPIDVVQVPEVGVVTETSPVQIPLTPSGDTYEAMDASGGGATPPSLPPRVSQVPSLPPPPLPPPSLPPPPPPTTTDATYEAIDTKRSLDEGGVSSVPPLPPRPGQVSDLPPPPPPSSLPPPSSTLPPPSSTLPPPPLPPPPSSSEPCIDTTYEAIEARPLEMGVVSNVGVTPEVNVSPPSLPPRPAPHSEPLDSNPVSSPPPNSEYEAIDFKPLEQGHMPIKGAEPIRSPSKGGPPPPLPTRSVNTQLSSPSRLSTVPEVIVEEGGRVSRTYEEVDTNSPRKYPSAPSPLVSVTCLKFNFISFEN